LFFKWIKQHLKIKKFWGHSENAVKTQIWIAICIYLLVAIAKKVSLTPTGKDFVSILCEEEYQPLPKTKKATGIDVGLKDYATLANGAKSKNHKHLKIYSKKLATAQKHLSRKQKGSRSFKKQRRKAARLHERIANCRRHMLQKLATALIKRYDVTASKI